MKNCQKSQNIWKMMFSLTITFMLSCLYGRSTTVVTQAAQSTFYRECAQDCDRRPTTLLRSHSWIFLSSRRCPRHRNANRGTGLVPCCYFISMNISMFNLSTKWQNKLIEEHLNSRKAFTCVIQILTSWFDNISEEKNIIDHLWDIR